MAMIGGIGRGSELSADASTRVIVALVIGMHILIAMFFAFNAPYPNPFDELAHVSAVREQLAHPTLFPDMSAYRLLDADDSSRWSGAGNYLNHPSLYYLAMAAFSGVTDAILPARLLNVVLSTIALALVIYAGWRRFDSMFGRAVFAVAAAAFPKQPVIAGGVNNDNLASCAAAIVFVGMMANRGAHWWLAAGLALAGWTKLTALLALAAVVGCRQLAQSVAGMVRWISRENIVIATGLVIGCVPYLVNLLQFGQLLYVNEDHFRVPVDARPALDMLAFLQLFLSQLAMKWPAAEYGLPLAVAAPLALLAPVLAVAASVTRRGVASVGVPYLAGIAVMLAIHAWFGWNAYQRIGDLTIAQARYYNVLWPGIVFAAAMMIAPPGKPARWTGMLLLALLLVPTVIGGMAVALIA